MLAFDYAAVISAASAFVSLLVSARLGAENLKLARISFDVQTQSRRLEDSREKDRRRVDLGSATPVMFGMVEKLSSLRSAMNRVRVSVSVPTVLRDVDRRRERPSWSNECVVSLPPGLKEDAAAFVRIFPATPMIVLTIHSALEQLNEKSQAVHLPIAEPLGEEAIKSHLASWLKRAGAIDGMVEQASAQLMQSVEDELSCRGT